MAKYLNIIEYRVKDYGGGASGIKTLEIELNRELHPSNKDYDEVLKNLVQSHTGISVDRIIQYRVKKRVKIGGSKDMNNSNNYNQENDSVLSKSISSIGSGLKKIADEANEREEKNKRKRKKQLDEKIAQIQSIQFGDSTKSKMQELMSLASSITSEELPLKKAIYSKIITGIETLKQSGEDTSKFEEQAKRIRPKWFHKVEYWFHTI